MLIHSKHMHDIWSVYSIVVFLTMKKRILRGKKSTLQLNFLCSCVLQTPQSHQTTLRNVWTAEDEGEHWRKPSMDATALDPKMFWGVILLSVYRHQKKSSSHWTLACPLLFLNICCLHHLMSLPEIRKVKHLHQLQADTQNPFNNSPEDAVCLIHFSMN